ncbi:hypothetical protein HXX25_01340 [Hyphobacterium sp. CCMP332]|jgi:hypothetical protein|uniref:hypothetical protein n=1 Tax=unclassified Hyphobacterium TaxID=2638931 RepID=UPI0016509AD9|nr:hypothetical protein [Hyphobacterium sp. CCMP332]QNL18097.1 hypothetical protein HXX25_01340 [Hyphobacterium sp. CCMP332]
MDAILDRLSGGFTATDWWLILVWSLFGALIMRRASQLPVVVGLAFVADTITPYFLRIATGVTPDFAFDLMLARLDERGGLVLLARLFIYFVLIGLLFAARGRFGRR